MAQPRVRRWWWDLHPFLVALYFVLSLAAANTEALHGWRDLVLPAAISLAFCAGCWLLAFALTGREQKTALMTLLWVVAFSIFGYVAEALRSGGLLRRVGGEPALVSLFALAVFGPSLAIRRTGRGLEPLNRYLTLVALVLVGYTAWLVSRDLVRQPVGVTPLELPAARTDHEQNGELPDIYLIVLDKYTSSEVLAGSLRLRQQRVRGFSPEPRLHRPSPSAGQLPSYPARPHVHLEPGLRPELAAAATPERPDRAQSPRGIPEARGLPLRLLPDGVQVYLQESVRRPAIASATRSERRVPCCLGADHDAAGAHPRRLCAAGMRGRAVPARTRDGRTHGLEIRAYG